MPNESAGDASADKKSHRERHSGRKAVKKKQKKDAVNPVEELSDKQRNPKAFAFNSAVRAERRFRRKQDIDTKKQHIPLVDRTPVEPPPILVGVVGPPKVGKSTLIKNLIKLFTRSPLVEIKGPVTVVIGKKRRITFIECNNDINSMIDLAKVADLVLLLCDASFGFEMEVFEFLNVCQVHGMPRIMGILTHLDMIKNAKTLKNTKKVLKHRFWTEVYPGAKLFYLSGIIHEEYLRNEIKNLGRFISVMKFRPLTWRSTHGYLLGDRYEDLTNQDLIRKNPKCDRNISLYGYVRGVPIKKESSVHVPGLGDLKIHEISYLPDPCPLPEQLKKRALVEKEKLIYAPFSGVGGIVYDKDAVYVELGGSHSHKGRNEEDEADNIITNLIDVENTIDKKMGLSKLQIFTGGAEFTSKDFEDDEEKSGSDEESDAEDFEEPEAGNSKKGDSGLEDELNEESVIDGVTEKTGRKVSFLNSDDESSEESEEEIESKVEKATKKPDKIKGILKNPDKKQEESEEDSSDEEEDGDNLNQKDNFEEVVKRDDLGLEDELKELRQLNRHNEEAVIDESTGRTRRKVIFDTPDDFSDESSENEAPSPEKPSKKSEVTGKIGDILKKLDQKEEEPEGDSSEDDEDEDGDLKWKDNLAEKAKQAFLDRQSTNQNLMKLVYGIFDVKTDNEETTIEVSKEDDDDDATAGGLFKRVSQTQQKLRIDKDTMNLVETSLMMPWNHPHKDWLEDNNKILITNCFVTGNWKKSEDAGELLRLDDAEDLSDAEMFGDFEDLETGTKHVSDPQETANKRKREDGEKDENADKQALAEKKRKLKEQFDEEYDTTEKTSFYDDLKTSAEKQAQLNKTVFENMPDEVRVQIEGYRPGMYVRVEFKDVPSEFVTNFDPTYPLVMGALNMGEENIGFVNVKIKKHRWYKRILKTGDPLIISLGWRRFQTIPMYSKLEDDLKFRFLKYTPEHLGCNAHFWGPVTPQGTGFLALQSVESNPELLKKQGFRIAATGAVQELDKSTQIMKKLKLIGYPLKIYKKTAFIKGMFNTALEVARFEGARIKTVSGIRGQIKKAVNKPEGCFRATFEDKIQLSDIIFCRTWYKVDVPEFYTPVTTLLLPQEEKNSWRGVRTTGEIKREKGIRNPVNKDSLYTPVERQEKPFKPLIIPNKLQKALPYRDKPKNGIRNDEKKKQLDRVAVIKEPHEQKVSKLLKMVKTTYEHKQEKMKLETKERMEKHRLMIEARESLKDKKLREKKKEVFRKRSKAQSKTDRGK